MKISTDNQSNRDENKASSVCCNSMKLGAQSSRGKDSGGMAAN